MHSFNRPRARLALSAVTGSFQRWYTASARRSQAVSGAAEAELQSARSYCLNLLRHYDSPSFTLQTFIPPRARDAYIAIRAFNIETARIADATSNATVGAMRMQFWRDAVTKALTGTPPKEPVAVLLSSAATDAVSRTDGHARLSKSWLLRVINTREQHLANPPFPTLSALEQYAELTYSSLLYATLSALPLASITADHLASHVGKATGIAAVLRGLPLLAFPPPPNHHSNNAAFGGTPTGGRQGAVTLPLDIMADTGVKEEDVLRQGPSAPGLRDAVFTVATRANDHLITVEEMLKNLRAGLGPGHEFEHRDDRDHLYGAAEAGVDAPNADVERAFGVLMQAVPTRLWLERLQKSDFDIFSPGLRTTDWRLPLRAYWAYTRRRL